jgi:mannose-6-phosphate isomerase-like protein (cupin superfamily)
MIHRFTFRSVCFAAAMTVGAGMPSLAQPVVPASATPTPANLKAIATSAEVEELVAKIKAMPPRPLIVQAFAGAGPYRVTLEYRQGQQTTASLHETEGELDYVIDGAGTFVYGGTLVEPKRMNATNQSGTKIEGGTSSHISKGDWIILPANTAHHTIPDVGGSVALMTFHIPALAAPK